MRYYVYLSEPKVSMLHSQIAASTGKTREASIGFDIKLLKGKIKESHGLPENSYIKLDEVLKALRDSDLVGTVELPKQYIAGSLPMSWSTYAEMGDEEDSPITFWGYCQNAKRPWPGTVLALAGSKYNLLGNQHSGNVDSHSGTPEMTRWFLKNLDDPFPDGDQLSSQIERYLDPRSRMDNDAVANGAWLAATQERPIAGTFEFVAKVLCDKSTPDGFRMTKTTRILLASPLYVALSEVVG